MAAKPSRRGARSLARAPEGQKFFTVPQAAAELELDAQTIRRALQRGHLVASAHGPSSFVLIERAALEAFAATHGPDYRARRRDVAAATPPSSS